MESFTKAPQTNTASRFTKPPPSRDDTPATIQQTQESQRYQSGANRFLSATVDTHWRYHTIKSSYNRVDPLYATMIPSSTGSRPRRRDVELAVDETTLANILTTQSCILLASDGGAVPGRGSFGWVLQIGNTIIARGKGPAYGPDPRSFRAEGYGMASGLLFIHLLQQHFAITWSNERGNKLICDNEGLLIRIEKTLTWTYLQPNVTLRSEWDIESVILDAYKNIGWQE